MLLTIDLAVIIVVTIAVRAASFELKIRPTGEKFIKPQGIATLFTCEVSGAKDGEVRIQWQDNSRRDIPEDTTKRIYVESTVESSDSIFSKKLYITSIQNLDAGHYYCVASTMAGQQTKSVELGFFKDITFDHVPNPQHPMINTTAVIKCIVSGSPQPEVSWRYNGKPLETGRRYTKLDDGLQIANITLADDGNYTCRAEVENEGRYDERRITVAVHIPPRVIDGPGFKEEIEGREVTLTCRADGHPSPKFQFKNSRGDTVLNTDRIQVDADAGRISFRPVSKDDDGEYTCKAHNDVGEDSKKGTLQVLVPPRIREFHNITRSEFEVGTLICRASGHPAPEMFFQKEGNQFPFQTGVNEGGNIHVSKKGSGHLELTIRNLSPADAANYTCLSQNSAGRTNKTAIIDVHFKPRFGDDNKKLVYSWAGARHNISCHVRGQPIPEIKWIRYGRQLANNETFQIFYSGRQSNLQVRIKEADQSWVYGDYFCHASNSKGSADEKFQLTRATVPDKPQHVRDVEVSPNQVVLRIDPPRENGGVSIIGYRVEFENNIQDVSVSEHLGPQIDEKRPNRDWHKNYSLNFDTEVSVDNLRPGTKYVFRIRAKNEVGVGGSQEHMVTTANLTNPYPIKVTSPRESSFSREYQITWAVPKTGGRPIKSYEFKYRKTKIPTEDFSVKTDDWNSDTKYDDPVHPICEYRLRGLAPKTEYELQVIAKNELGVSLPNEKFYFLTSDGEDPEPTLVRTFVSPAAGIGIALIIFVIIFIIVDISCYFLNGCGFTMFVCVHICEKLQLKNENEDAESGNGKAVLKQPLQPIEQGKAGHRHDMTELQEVEEGNEDATAPLRGGCCTEDEEKKTASNRKSVLSQGDERWKDVVQELEKELSIKRSLSENESHATSKQEKPEILISEELDFEEVVLYQHTELPQCIPEHESIANEEAASGTTAEMECAPVESEEAESTTNEEEEEEPLFLLQENEAQTSADEDKTPDESADVEPKARAYDAVLAYDEDDAESDAKESAAACDYETLMCEGVEAKSTAQGTQLLFEAESPVVNLEQLPKPIGADWDNSFLQDDDQVELAADVADQKPLLEENVFSGKDFNRDCSESNTTPPTDSDSNLNSF